LGDGIRAADPSDHDRYAVVLAPDYNGDGFVLTVLANGAAVLTLEWEEGVEDWTVGDRAHLLIPEEDKGYTAQAAAGLLTRIGHVGEDFGSLVAEVGFYRAFDLAVEATDDPGLWVEDGHEWVAFLGDLQDYGVSYLRS